MSERSFAKLRDCLPTDQFHLCATLPMCHCTALPLCHCTTVSHCCQFATLPLCNCVTVPLCHFATVKLCQIATDQFCHWLTCACPHFFLSSSIWWSFLMNLKAIGCSSGKVDSMCPRHVFAQWPCFYDDWKGKGFWLTRSPLLASYLVPPNPTSAYGATSI